MFLPSLIFVEYGLIFFFELISFGTHPFFALHDSNIQASFKLLHKRRKVLRAQISTESSLGHKIKI